MADCAERLTDVVRGCGTSRYDIDTRSLCVVLDRDMSSSDVGNHCRNEKRRNPLARRVLDHLRSLAVLNFKSADSGTDINTEPERVNVLSFALGDQTGLVHSLVCRSYTILCKEVLFPAETFVHSVILRMEILDLSCDSYRKIFCRKLLDIIYTANAVHEIVPECRHVISDWGNDTHSCYYYSFCHIILFFIQGFINLL